jgi:predicted protein tyrosine phosphatase
MNIDELIESCTERGQLNGTWFKQSLFKLINEQVIGEDIPKDYLYDDPEAIQYFNILKERQRQTLKTLFGGQTK